MDRLILFNLVYVFLVIEGYFFPGGFPGFMKAASLSMAAFITSEFAIIINFLLLAAIPWST